MKDTFVFLNYMGEVGGADLQLFFNKQIDGTT